MMKKGDTIKLSLKNDIIFKAVYGRDTEECKFLLIALLNVILDRKEDPIVDLEYKNPFQIRERREEKESVLDIKVETSSGELIDIEMQIIRHESLVNRTLYYHGGSIREALKKGETYDKLLKTITICIVDDILFDETEDFQNVFYLMEREKHFKLTDMVALYYIELPKVNREHRPLEELTPLELCLEYLKYAGEEESEYVKALVAQGGKEFAMAQHVLKKTTQEEILREKALAREKFVRDYNSGLHDSYQLGQKEGFELGKKDGFELGKKDGFELGKKDGFEQGQKDAQRDLIKRMNKNGMDAVQIAQAVELSIEIVKRYIKE